MLCLRPPFDRKGHRTLRTGRQQENWRIQVNNEPKVMQKTNKKNPRELCWCCLPSIETLFTALVSNTNQKKKRRVLHRQQNKIHRKWMELKYRLHVFLFICTNNTNTVFTQIVAGGVYLYSWSAEKTDVYLWKCFFRILRYFLEAPGVY